MAIVTRHSASIRSARVLGLGQCLTLGVFLFTACAGPRTPFEITPAEYEHATATIKKSTQAIRTNPEDGIAYSNRSAARYRLWDYKGALDDATKAIQLRPNDPIAYANRAAAKYAYGDEEGAMTDAQEALRLDPTLEAARETLRQAKQSFESNPRYSLGYLRANEFDAPGAARTLSPEAIHQAIERASTKLQLNPRDAQAHVDRAAMRIYADEYSGALADASEALRLDPNLATAYLIRSFAKQKLGDAAGAQEDHEKANTLLVDEGFAERRRKREAGEHARFDESGSTPAQTHPAKIDGLMRTLKQRALQLTYYPDGAREQMLEGTVLVYVQIDRQGNLVQNRIRTSSGHAILDRAALLTVQAMFPIPLNEPLDRDMAILLPFNYRLEM